MIFESDNPNKEGTVNAVTKHWHARLRDTVNPHQIEYSRSVESFDSKDCNVWGLLVALPVPGFNGGPTVVVMHDIGIRLIQK